MELEFSWARSPQHAKRPLRWNFFNGALDIEGTGVKDDLFGAGTGGAWIVCEIRGAPEKELLAMADAMVTLVELRVYGSDA